MNCTKCGKEIPDGENTLCEECQKKEQEEKSEVDTEVKAEVKQEEKQESKKEEKEAEPSKSEKEKAESNKSMRNIIIAIVAIVIVVVLAFMFFTGKNKEGNTIGNIRNYGYAAKQGNWIYYLSPNEDSTQSGIFKVKTNGKSKKELYMGEMDVLSINAVGNYLYFIGIGTESFSDEDATDNKIYRMKTNGGELEVLNDNEFNNECYEIYVINNSIYYIGVDANIYKMNLDGSNKEVVMENETGYLGLTSKYIIFNKMGEETTSDYVTYIANLDGSNARPIIKDKRLYSVSVEGDYVYYTTSEKEVYRTKIDSNNEELLLQDTAYNLNCDGKYLYFLNYSDMANEDYTVCIYRLKADGSISEPEKLKDLNTYSSFLNVVGNHLIYMDGNNDAAFINMLKSDGKDEIELYHLDYEEYYDSIEETDDTRTPTETDTNTEVPNENTVISQ